MKLPFKEFLLNKTRELGVKFFENEIYKYAEELNGIDGKRTDEDLAKCFATIRYSDDKLYCGEGISDRARYYIMDGAYNLIWFSSAKDAILYAVPESRAALGASAYAESIFSKYHQFYYEGFYFLYPEDLDNLDSILAQQRGFICLDRNIHFKTEGEIVQWLVNSGMASNEGNARKQLAKHLAGETNTCYKLRFKKL